MKYVHTAGFPDIFYFLYTITRLVFTTEFLTYISVGTCVEKASVNTFLIPEVQLFSNYFSAFEKMHIPHTLFFWWPNVIFVKRTSFFQHLFFSCYYFWNRRVCIRDSARDGGWRPVKNSFAIEYDCVRVPLFVVV